MSRESAHSDETLAALATAGDAQALAALLRRHERWIFNLALYMLQVRADAQDATQEVLVKVATRLDTYRAASALKTWIYRIAVRHVLDIRRSGAEQAVKSFECFADYLETTPLENADSQSPEWALLVAEAQSTCTMGMLLCFDRSQRLVFLLGELLELNDGVAAAVLDISRDNFRQRLARAREQLAAFMDARCGLMNPQNPCRCARKTAAFVRDGVVDPRRLQFVDAHVVRARAAAPERTQQLKVLQTTTLERLRDVYALHEPPGVAQQVAHWLTTSEVRETLDLDPDDLHS